MRRTWKSLGVGVSIGAMALAGALAWPSGSVATAPPTLDELATRAVEDPDASEREAAITALRSRGLEGHEALTRVHARDIRALRDGDFEGDPTALRHAVDVVSGQRDAHASGLYWHTDLAAAQRVARATGRPILSLRLLGELDEELSCANSRFFRVVLYSDPRVSQMLRRQFVLHWSSERPAPRIEIDMGDGRRVVRTITGNSAHYVLDADGHPRDVIVGLYAPDHFRRVLGHARARTVDCDGRCARASHRNAEAALVRAWRRSRRQDADLPEWDAMLRSLPGRDGELAPSALAAMPMAMGKAFVEAPMLDLMRRDGATAPPPEPQWAQIAAARGIGVAPLASRTRALLRLKTGRDDVDTMAAELARTAAADGVRNEVLFHQRVHGWYASGQAGLSDFETLNTRVYSELMRTPRSDPWLGLRDESVYDGLEVER